MSAVHLILLTNSFPFGHQEPYLMNEIAHYGQFKTVTVVALSVKAHQEEYVRLLPRDDVRVEAVSFRRPIFYIANLYRVLPQIALWREIVSMIRNRRLTLRRFAQALGFFSRAETEAAEVFRRLRLYSDISKDDAVVLYSYRFQYQPYIMQRLRRLYPNSTLVARAHGIDLYEYRSPTGFLPAREYNLNALDEVHVVSKHGAKYLSEHYPAYIQKIRVAYLGTNDNGVRRVGRTANCLNIVSCSQLVAVKRVPLLVRALGLLPERLSVSWVHYGDGAEFEQVKSLSRSLPGHVQYDLRGWTSNSEILDAYRRGEHDAFINVSESEGLPVSIMEAMSFGIPAIATDVGGSSEVVVDGHNGLLLAASADAGDIAASIAKMAGLSNSEYKEMSLRARRHWETHFDQESNYASFIEALMAAAEGHTRI